MDYWTKIDQLSRAVLSFVIAHDDGLMDARILADELICDHPWLSDEKSLRKVWSSTRSHCAIWDELEFNALNRADELPPIKEWNLSICAFFAMLEDVNSRVEEIAKMECWVSDWGNRVEWKTN